MLRVQLDARRRVIDVAGAPLEAQPFNGRLIGPTLRCAGAPALAEMLNLSSARRDQAPTLRN